MRVSPDERLAVLRSAGGDGEADGGEGGGAAAGAEGERRAAAAGEGAGGGAGGAGEPSAGAAGDAQHRDDRPAAADTGLRETAGEEPQVHGRESLQHAASTCSSFLTIRTFFLCNLSLYLAIFLRNSEFLRSSHFFSQFCFYQSSDFFWFNNSGFFLQF